VKLRNTAAFCLAAAFVGSTAIAIRQIQGQSEPQQKDQSRVQLLDRSAETLAIRAKLREPIALDFTRTRLSDALKFVKSATVGPNDSGIPIYVDPIGLQEAEKTMNSRVSIKAKGIPLKTSLKYLLKPLGLTYRVKEGLLTITSESSEGGDPETTKSIEAKLQTKLALDFENTPLKEVLDFVQAASQGPNDPGLALVVDPVGLREAKVTESTPVSIQAKELPLEISLKWLLKPLGLAYTFEDGFLMITSETFLDR
jgi:hypothetical protein